MNKYGLDFPSLAIGCFVGASTIMLGAVDKWSDSVWAFAGGAAASFIPAVVAVAFPLWLHRQEQQKNRRMAAQIASPYIGRASAMVRAAGDRSPDDMVRLDHGRSCSGHVAAADAVRSALHELKNVRNSDIACIDGAVTYNCWVQSLLSDALRKYEDESILPVQRHEQIITDTRNLAYTLNNFSELVDRHGASMWSPL